MTEKLSTEYLEGVAVSLAEIKSAADRAGAKVVAATKTVPAEVIRFAFEHGLEYMGENRVQELLGKIDSLPFGGDRIHFIGRLQTNKVKYLVGRVGMIHSLDSLRLAKEISARFVSGVDCLVEINAGHEGEKGGVYAEDCESFVDSLTGLPNINLRGLMSIGPYMENKEDYRPYMEKVAELFERMRSRGYFGSEPQLSMGMSDNYRLALEYGATIIRPGTAIFGRRNAV
jgi:pyridoxal phosphate enzyme (YggS family)